MKEFVISSVVVYCRNKNAEKNVSQHVAQMNTCTYYPNLSNPGKLVVVIECESTRATEAAIRELEKLPGVLNVSMVYNHIDKEENINEEIV